MTDRLRERLRSLSSEGRALAERGLDGLEDVGNVPDRARAVWAIVTPLGRTVMAIGVAAWFVGWWLGWLEFMIAAAACLLLVVVGIAFVIGSSPIRIHLTLEPPRVTAGQPSAGAVAVTNEAGRHSAPVRVEVRIGGGVAAFDVPSLTPGTSREELFVIPTERRGVIPVGPATSVRSDPLGMFQRKSSASDATELIVHPIAVSLEPFGTGLLRDLEGLTTTDLSASDLAFHALREYVPGDDRRHIHWKSSAKLNSRNPDGGAQHLVRQYLETRRSAFCVVVDGRPSSYGDPAEFELAMQVAASIVLRGCRDGVPSVLVAADHVATGVSPHLLLDALARAELTSRGPDLATQVGKAAATDGDVSVAIMVSGSASAPLELERAAARLDPDVRILGIRIVLGEMPGVTVTNRGVIARLGELTDLPVLLRKEVAA